jgi:SAM-dependent methyltransferase
MDGQTSSAPNGLSEADLQRFCEDIFPDEPIYERFVNEARFGLSRILPVLSSLDLETAEILEVGAGSCILAAYLASRRLQVTVIEPLGAEFEHFAPLQARVLEFCRGRDIAFTLARMTGEQLDLLRRFDVAYTINALEHMQNPMLTIDNMFNSLKKGGILLAHCPNYTVPFEVHLNIFLVTRSKSINERLYRSKIKRYGDIWQELNFIRYVDLRRHLSRRDMRFKFNNRVTGDLIARLLTDPIFAQRMPRLLQAVAAGLMYSGLAKALMLIPPRFQTPMEVLVEKTGAADAA